MLEGGRSVATRHSDLPSFKCGKTRKVMRTLGFDEYVAFV